MPWNLKIGTLFKRVRSDGSSLRKPLFKKNKVWIWCGSGKIYAVLSNFGFVAKFPGKYQNKDFIKGWGDLEEMNFLDVCVFFYFLEWQGEVIEKNNRRTSRDTVGSVQQVQEQLLVASFCSCTLCTTCRTEPTISREVLLLFFSITYPCFPIHGKFPFFANSGPRPRWPCCFLISSSLSHSQPPPTCPAPLTLAFIIHHHLTALSKNTRDK